MSKNKIVEPSYAGLSLPPLPDKLSSAAAKAVAEYHGDCQQFEQDIAALHDRRRALHEQSNDLTIAVIAETGSDLQAEKTKLTETLIDLRWRRVELLPKLVGDFTKALEVAQQNYDLAFATEAERYKAAGVDGLTLVPGNKRAGTIQLRVKIDGELAVLAAKHKVKAAEATRDLIDTKTIAPPSWKSLRIPWPPITGQHTHEIDSIAGLAEAPPLSILSSDYESVAMELGLGNTIMPPRHQEPFDRLVGLVGKKDGARRVEHAICQSGDSYQVLSLIKKLPTTNLISEMMMRIKAVERLPAPTKKRTLVTK